MEWNELAVLFLSLYIVDSIIIFFLFVFNKKSSRHSHPKYYPFFKLLLVPLAGGLWYQISQRREKTVQMFLLMCWLGDAILIGESSFLFTVLGGLFFGIAHISLIHQFNIKLSEIPVYGYVMMMPTLVLVFGFMLKELNVNNKAHVGAFMYFFVLCLGFVSAVARCSTMPVTSPSFILIALGYQFFVVSDFFLMKRTFGFYPSTYRKRVIVTYMIAQLLLVIGLGYQL